jgi:RNA polymerase sigma-70 factor (ECF subfamily)
MEINKKLLIQKLIDGNREAYTSLFRTYYKILCIYSYKFVRNLDIAEEIVQDIFFRIWEKRRSLNLPENIESYLYRAVHNESINTCKKLQRELINKNEYKEEVDYIENYEDPLVHEELNTKIRFAVDELPERCREVFKMHRYNNLTYKEISIKLGITEKGVEFHILKALKILREKLKECLVPILLCIINLFIY